MAKIPTHFRPKAVSARTGVPAQDPSGAIIAGAVQNLASTFFSGVLALEVKSKKLVDDSTRAKAIGNYSTDYLQEANQIKQDNIDDPTRTVALLKEARSRLKDEHVDSLTDQGLQQEFAFDVDNINVQEDIRDVAWKIEQSAKISQQNYLNRISSDAKAAAQTGSYEEYLKKVDLFQAEEENPDGNRKLSQAFGGIKEGQKVLNQGLESITRGFISGKMARGESFEAAQRVIRGDFDPFIEPDVKAELLKKLDQAQKGEVTQSNFLQAAEAAVDIFQTSTDVISDKMDIVGLEEKISQTSFALIQAEQVGATPERISALTKQSNLLERIRDIKLEEIETNAKDDIETKANLLSDYQFLVDYEEGQNSLVDTLDKVLDFQRDATEAYYNQKISKTTYDKWMLFAKTAIQNDITEGMREKGEGFQVPNEGGFLGIGSTNPLSSSKKVRKRLQDILRSSNKNLGREHAIDTLDFYMDLLNDHVGGDLSSLDKMGDETHDFLLKNAKARSTLKQMGLPVYLTVGDKVPVSNIAYEIVGFDKDGMPQIKIEE